MANMGRKRKADSGLEPRVYLNHGAYFYVHRDGGRWERLGTDKNDANAKARIYNDPNGRHGTMGYWLDMFLMDCERRVGLKSTVKGIKLSQRTLDDYKEAVGTEEAPGPLRVYFRPPMTPRDITPGMIQTFLRDSGEAGRPVKGNRDKACLSSCFGWLLREDKVPGLATNPCVRAAGVQRNPESKRVRYVTNEEYMEVWAVATRSERLLMALTYRTLQRPESDIILWDRREVVKVQAGKRVLAFKQHKTGRDMVIAFSSELDELIPVESVVALRRNTPDPVVRRLNGGFYTYDGLSGMLKKSIETANVRRAARGKPPIPSFGYRDLKGKGATDMWLAGTPVEVIQALLGHATKATTEIYVKQRWVEAAQPNQVKMA